MAVVSRNHSTTVPESWDRSGLPGWTYFSEELHELERNEIFRNHWQCVCHVNDIPDPGDFRSFDIAGERALILRDTDGHVRAFHNVCRHRGSRVVAGERGNCRNVIVCPYHGWTYNLNGSLRGAARSETFPRLDALEWALREVEHEVWLGFIFVRFKPGPQGSVAELFGRVEEEASLYDPEGLLPADSGDFLDRLDVNWKSVRDVDNEGYHVQQAHPGLHDLYGQNYHDEPYVDGVARSVGRFNRGPGSLWSVRNYRKILPTAHWLPESHRDAWLYIGLFPNLVLGFYPDSVIFYQEIPVSATCTIQRGSTYRRKNESRELRLARYLSGRIDRDAVEEDRLLAVWSCEATKSSAYEGVILSDLEYGLKTFHDHLRVILPVLSIEDEPPHGSIASANSSLLAERIP